MPFKATMMLADSAQVADGKLYVLGGGWALIGPDPNPSAVVMFIEVSWDLANMQHEFRLELLDSDGNPVEVPTPMGDQPLLIGGPFEVGRPPGITPGTPLGIPVAINLGPLPLRPGTRYEWRLTINDESDQNWRLPFSTRPAAGPPQMFAPGMQPPPEQD
jgi:hypothetical protein